MEAQPLGRTPAVFRQRGAEVRLVWHLRAAPVCYPAVDEARPAAAPWHGAARGRREIDWESGSVIDRKSFSSPQRAGTPGHADLSGPRR